MADDSTPRRIRAKIAKLLPKLRSLPVRQRGRPRRPPGRRPLAPPPQPRPWTRGVPAAQTVRARQSRRAQDGRRGGATTRLHRRRRCFVFVRPSWRPYGSIEGPAQKRHERLVERWEDIRRLHLAGARVKDIAEWVGTSQSTVYRYREMTEPPPRPRYRRRTSILDPYLPYLLKRWNEGCRSAKRLH
jgi:hypothetical protein